MLSEALIDEPWPWWSGEELKWWTGRFQVDNIYLRMSCVSPGLTAQEQKEKCAGRSVYVVHSVIADFGCVCAASQEVTCEGMARTVELLYASQSNDSKTLYVWRLISNIAHQQQRHVLVNIKK